jgi:hypothetical protein
MKYLLLLWVYGQPHMQQFDTLQDCERVKSLIIEHGTHHYPDVHLVEKDVDGAQCLKLSGGQP